MPGKRSLPDHTCPNCGAMFRPYRGSSKYCSRACSWANNGGQNAKLQSWWLGGKGYIQGRILTAQGQRHVRLHRFIMECQIGRRLRPHEDVHHLNGCKTDNRPENLELLTHGQHSSITNNERHARTRGQR